MGIQMQVVYLKGEENTSRGVDETRERRKPTRGLSPSQLQPWMPGVPSHGVKAKHLPPSYHTQGWRIWGVYTTVPISHWLKAATKECNPWNFRSTTWARKTCLREKILEHRNARVCRWKWKMWQSTGGICHRVATTGSSTCLHYPNRWKRREPTFSKYLLQVTYIAHVITSNP